jgi:hypothetical protein
MKTWGMRRIAAGILSLVTVSLCAWANIDAVTGATVNNACKFTSIVPTASSVTLKWSETESGGTATICYGQSTPPATCRSVTSAERSAKTIVLTGLKPSASYYVTLDIREGTSMSHWYMASSQFTTLKTSVRDRAVENRRFLSIKVGTRTIRNVHPGDRYFFTSLNGALLSQGMVTEEGQQLAPEYNKTGIYLLSIKRNGRAVLATAVMVKGNRS